MAPSGREPLADPLLRCRRRGRQRWSSRAAPPRSAASAEPTDPCARGRDRDSAIQAHTSRDDVAAARARLPRSCTRHSCRRRSRRRRRALGTGLAASVTAQIGGHTDVARLRHAGVDTAPSRPGVTQPSLAVAAHAETSAREHARQLHGSVAPRSGSGVRRGRGPEGGRREDAAVRPPVRHRSADGENRDETLWNIYRGTLPSARSRWSWSA